MQGADQRSAYLQGHSDKYIMNAFAFIIS